jgi:glycosyltransferase involved in cell wall biosynthesis
MAMISLIVSVLGADDGLVNTLASIAAQDTDRTNFETIIVTDGLDPNRIASEHVLLERDRIETVVINLGSNCSATSARNRGWRAATSRWVLFLECGDLLAPNLLGLMASVTQQPARHFDVLCAKWQRLGFWYGRWVPFGPFVSPPFMDPAKLQFALVRQQSFVGRFLVRRKVLDTIGGYPDATDAPDDMKLIKKILEVGGWVAEVPSQSPLLFVRDEREERKVWSRRARVARHSPRNPETARAVARSTSPSAAVWMGARSVVSGMRVIWAAMLTLANGLGASWFVITNWFTRIASTTSAGFSLVASLCLDAGSRLLDLPIAAYDWIARAVAASAEIAWNWMTSSLKSTWDASMRLARLPTVTLHWLVGKVSKSMRSIWKCVVTYARSALSALLWLASVPFIYLRWLAVTLALAAAWSWRQVIGGLRTMLQATLWVVHLPVVVLGFSAAVVITLVTRCWTIVVTGAKISVGAAIWLVRLPLAGANLIASTSANGATSIWNHLVSASEVFVRSSLWLATRPTAAWQAAGTGARMIGSLISRAVSSARCALVYASERSWAARYHAAATSMNLAIVGGLIGVLLIDDPTARVMRKSSSPPHFADSYSSVTSVPSIARIRPSTVEQTAEDVPGNGAPKPTNENKAHVKDGTTDSSPLQSTSRDPVERFPPTSAAPIISLPLAETAPQDNDRQFAGSASELFPVDSQNDRAPEIASAAVENRAAAESKLERPPTLTAPVDNAGEALIQRAGSEPEPVPLPRSAEEELAHRDDASEASKLTVVPTPPIEVAMPAAGKEVLHAPRPAAVTELVDDKSKQESVVRPGKGGDENPQVPRKDGTNAQSDDLTSFTQQRTENLSVQTTGDHVSAGEPGAKRQPEPSSDDKAASAALGANEGNAAPTSDLAVAEPATAVSERTPMRPAPQLSVGGLETGKPPSNRSGIGPAELERVDRLVARGERELGNGNVASARQFFLRAADAGLARGALLLGASYDARELARLGVIGVRPDEEIARKWYYRARDLGAVDVDERLATLGKP